MSDKPSSSWRRQVTRLVQRFGLGQVDPTSLKQTASQLALPPVTLHTHTDSIVWQDGLPLHQLPHLPRNALCGPVQEDKECAFNALTRLIDCDTESLAALDLREIDGISIVLDLPETATSMEQAAAAPCHRHVRLISFKDFQGALVKAVPEPRSAHPIELVSASWRGPRLFWRGQSHAAELIGAVVYARRRELVYMVPANITRYSLNQQAVDALRNSHDVLAIARDSWSDSRFTTLLVEYQVPYSRLPLPTALGNLDLLLLPRDSEVAQALATGLRRAGAVDVMSYLSDLNAQN